MKYISEDGVEFATEEECAKHEARLASDDAHVKLGEQIKALTTKFDVSVSSILLRLQDLEIRVQNNEARLAAHDNRFLDLDDDIEELSCQPTQPPQGRQVPHATVSVGLESEEYAHFAIYERTFPDGRRTCIAQIALPTSAIAKSGLPQDNAVEIMATTGGIVISGWTDKSPRENRAVIRDNYSPHLVRLSKTVLKLGDKEPSPWTNGLILGTATPKTKCRVLSVHWGRVVIELPSIAKKATKKDTIDVEFAEVGLSRTAGSNELVCDIRLTKSLADRVNGEVGGVLAFSVVHVKGLIILTPIKKGNPEKLTISPAVTNERGLKSISKVAILADGQQAKWTHGHIPARELAPLKCHAAVVDGEIAIESPFTKDQGE